MTASANARSRPADASADPVVTAERLVVSFRRSGRSHAFRAVDDVSLALHRGETLGLVGESGSGKSTTGRALLRLQPIERGRVSLLGQDLTQLRGARLRAMRRHMQFVLQNPYTSLNPRMTVGASLAEPLRLFQLADGPGIRKRVTELLEMVELTGAMARRYPHELSGGQRQRIVIARALAVSPDFIVCDEPVSALDVRIQAQVVELLQHLQQSTGVAYLFIAHDLAVVRQISHRVAVMFAGRIMELGTVEQLYGQPRHPYTRMLLRAVPVPDPRVQRERLASAAPKQDFHAAGRVTGTCPFGDEHPSDDAARLHEVEPGHLVSCDHWALDGGAGPVD